MKEIEIFGVTKWRADNSTYYLCDELAMACALDGTIMKQSHKHTVHVECQGQHTRGQVVVDWYSKPEDESGVKIVTELDTDALYRYLEKCSI